MVSQGGCRDIAAGHGDRDTTPAVPEDGAGAQDAGTKDAGTQDVGTQDADTQDMPAMPALRVPSGVQVSQQDLPLGLALANAGPSEVPDEVSAEQWAPRTDCSHTVCHRRPTGCRHFRMFRCRPVLRTKPPLLWRIGPLVTTLKEFTCWHMLWFVLQRRVPKTTAAAVTRGMIRVDRGWPV